jgi:hypothetical protein
MSACREKSTDSPERILQLELGCLIDRRTAGMIAVVGRRDAMTAGATARLFL